MQLIPDWKLAYKFSSIQLMVAATICDLIVAAAIIINESFPINPLVYVAIRLLMTAGAMLARLVAQPAIK